MNQQPSMILTLKVVEAERLKIASSKTLANVRFWGIATLDLTANEADCAAVPPLNRSGKNL